MKTRENGVRQYILMVPRHYTIGQIKSKETKNKRQILLLLAESLIGIVSNFPIVNLNTITLI